MPKRTNQAKRPDPAMPPDPAKRRRPNGLVIRATPEWREWLKRAALHERTTVADFLDRAAADRAKANGFPDPPPVR
jgi:hypothetical protein